MNELLQNAVVLAIVAAAAIYLAVRAWRVVVRRKTSSCGSCSGCSAASTGVKTTLISIEPPKRDK